MKRPSRYRSWCCRRRYRPRTDPPPQGDELDPRRDDEDEYRPGRARLARRPARRLHRPHRGHGRREERIR